MKQTAVEWLYERFLFAGYSAPAEWKDKAKEMEKEQIQDAFDIGFCEGFDFGYRDFDPTYESGEMYYDKTYGKK